MTMVQLTYRLIYRQCSLIEIIYVAITDKAGICAIHYAAEKGHIHVIEFLIKKKATLEIKTMVGNTALM